MSNSIPVIKFLFSSEFRVLNETLQAQPSYEVEDFNAVNDLATFVSTIPAGLIISSLCDKNDLVQIASFMKIVKKVAKDTAIKMVVINFSGDKQFEKAVAKLGIQDLVEPAINAKAFKFKLDFWMKSLNVQIKNNPNANAQKNVKSAEAAKAQDKKVDNSAPTWLEPLDLEDDIWIVSNETDCKKILSKWLIKLTGPGPYVGQWNDVQNNLWRFEIKGADKDMYVPGSGHWYFHGDVKPDFVWKENVWLITGDSFDLFYKDGDKVFSRLKCKDKNFTVCKNSLYAKTKEQVIKESFDKDMVFRKEAEALNDLEGKGKADAINGGPLSGKNKTSHLNQNPLSGEVNPEDQLLNTDPLTQNVSTDKQSSFWKGKNTYENEGGDGSGPASAGVHAGQNLEQENKKNEHQKYYKNHNEAEKYEAEKKEQERKLSEQQSGSGPLTGKSSTDEIDGHYSNNGERRAKSSAERSQSELSGKSETDKLNSHYGSKDGSSLPGKPERERTEHSSHDLKDGGLAGKGSTERMDSHYSNPDDAKNAKAKTEENKSRTSMASSEGTTTGKGSFSDTKDTAQNGSSHHAHAKDEKRGNEGAASIDPYESLFGKSKDRKEAPAAKKTERKLDADYTNFTDDDLRPSLDEKQKSALADVVSLNTYKNEKLKEALQESYDPEIEEASADAKVSSTMFFNSKTVDCRFDDFFDETIIFTTTDEGLSTDSKVDVDMSFKYLNQDTKVKIQGDVVTVEGDGEGNNYVTVQLSKDNVETFDKFMRLYKLRQENANSFIKKVKGL
ncbi:hypothetical protein [Peredibacter starrii]|uniref:Uncharacterized protein n=1 Tax=Peredibacter starrii TaxID=28202 RepID=A0AAX4HRI7_9BACT|nr:hypothetical protein [Peredibacter starrii]WPU65783.1 hypothetical protein SOO65_03390 [Peredibacter starrii]